MEETQIKKLIAFAVLMQNNRGIKDKSRAYVIEKYNSCMSMDEPELLLDSNNKEIFDEWFKTW